MEEAVFSVHWSVRRLYNASPLEAGLNTSTVAQPFIGGEEIFQYPVRCFVKLETSDKYLGSKHIDGKKNGSNI
jgi:hypothetical protein